MFSWVSIYFQKLYDSVVKIVCPPKPVIRELDARETIHERLLDLDDVAGYVKRKRERLTNEKYFKSS